MKDILDFITTFLVALIQFIIFCFAMAMYLFFIY